MIAVIQRVKKALVRIDNEIVSQIEKGILIFLGVEKGDSMEDVVVLANKVASLRIFDDDQGKLNLSIGDIEGDFMVVSQFTLPARLAKGRRPSFDRAMKGNDAAVLVEAFIRELEERRCTVKKGRFAAHMQVELINDGPVTLVVKVCNGKIVDI